MKKILFPILLFLLMSSQVFAQSVYDAIKNGQFQQVKTLIEANNKSINTPDKRGNTPLHHACLSSADSSMAIFDFLLNKGADINHANARGNTPLHLAAYLTNYEFVKKLIKKGANPNATNPAGHTPIHYTLFSPDRKATRLLIEQGANINFTDALGNTYLMLAILSEDIPTAKLLIEKNADLSIINKRGNNALSLSQRMQLKELSDLIINNGGKKIDNKKKIPLTGAYLGQETPGLTPLLFAPNVVSTENSQLNAVFPLMETNSFLLNGKETNQL